MVQTDGPILLHNLKIPPMSAWRPEHDKRQSKASAKVTDSTNTSKPELKSHQAARDLAASLALKKTRTFPPTTTSTELPVTTTISQSTAVKRKQPPASNLDVASEDESEAEHSHVLPKGIFPSHSESFLIAYNQFNFSLKEISCCAIR